MIEVFADFKEKNNIDRATLVSVLEECFRNVIAKMHGTDENYDIIVNPDKGDFEIYHNRVVVPDGEVNDKNKEISLSEAQQIEDDYEIGEEVSQRVDMSEFGRRAILQLRQTLASRIMELEYCTISTKTAKGKSSVQKCIRHGNARRFSWTKRATNCSFLAKNRFLATSSAKVKALVPSSCALRTQAASLASS